MNNSLIHRLYEKKNKEPQDPVSFQWRLNPSSNHISLKRTSLSVL